MALRAALSSLAAALKETLSMAFALTPPLTEVTEVVFFTGCAPYTPYAPVILMSMISLLSKQTCSFASTLVSAGAFDNIRFSPKKVESRNGIQT
jgi:hypothetical protein